MSAPAITQPFSLSVFSRSNSQSLVQTVNRSGRQLQCHRVAIQRSGAAVAHLSTPAINRCNCDRSFFYSIYQPVRLVNPTSQRDNTNERCSCSVLLSTCNQPISQSVGQSVPKPQCGYTNNGCSCSALASTCNHSISQSVVSCSVRQRVPMPQRGCTEVAAPWSAPAATRPFTQSISPSDSQSARQTVPMSQRGCTDVSASNVPWPALTFCYAIPKKHMVNICRLLVNLRIQQSWVGL